MHELMSHGAGPLRRGSVHPRQRQPVRELIALTREAIAQATSARGGLRRDPPALRAPARGRCLAARRLPAGRARERHGRRDRPVAAVPLRRRLAVAVLAGRPARAQTPVHDHLAWGLVGLYRGTQDEEVFVHQGESSSCVEKPLAVVRRLLRADPAARRHPPRAHDIARDVGVDPSADQRHRVRLASQFEPEPARSARSGPAM